MAVTTDRPTFVIIRKGNIFQKANVACFIVVPF